MRNITRRPPNWANEFPHFPPEDMPPIPEDWADDSWGNDTCPSFRVKGEERHGPFTKVMIEFADADSRELPDCKRFTMYRYLSDGTPADENGGLVCETDDWNELLAAVERERTAEQSR